LAAALDEVCQIGDHRLIGDGEAAAEVVPECDPQLGASLRGISIVNSIPRRKSDSEVCAT
jgi:hypothetical protein